MVITSKSTEVISDSLPFQGAVLRFNKSIRGEEMIIRPDKMVNVGSSF